MIIAIYGIWRYPRHPPSILPFKLEYVSQQCPTSVLKNEAMWDGEL